MRSYFLPLCVAATLVTPAVFAAEKSYPNTGFTEVTVSDGLEVHIKEGDFGITAEGSRIELGRLVIKQEGDELFIERKRRFSLGLPQLSDGPEVTVTLPLLEALEVRGGANVDARSIALAEDVDVEVTTGAYLEMEGLKARKISMKVTTGAHLAVEGVCTDLQASSRTGSDFAGKMLSCEVGDLSAYTGASLSAEITKTVSASAHSGASVRVTGGAQVTDMSTNSGGSVSIK